MSEPTVTTHRAEVVWKGTKQDLRAHTIRLAEQTLNCSSAPELGGNAALADPEELFVASLSSCHMLWFLYLAQRERHRVLAYADHPEGTMDGTRFVGVALRPRVTFETEVAPELIERLHHAAHAACFIANSVRCPVSIEPPSA
ncbi:MAG: OsmC family protein [Solirubrobacteraceae bacterium]|nr:MAG: hypothetical protein DLM63_11835 [Solirubrobacterales bacterium]